MLNNVITGKYRKNIPYILVDVKKIYACHPLVDNMRIFYIDGDIFIGFYTDKEKADCVINDWHMYFEDWQFQECIKHNVYIVKFADVEIKKEKGYYFGVCHNVPELKEVA